MGAARGGPSPPISTPGGEGGADGCLKAVQNFGEHSSSWFCIIFQVVPRFHRRFGRRWRPGEVGAPPRRIAPHHRGIRRSRCKKRAEWRRRLSSVILHRWWGRQTRPSPSRPAMVASPRISAPGGEGGGDRRRKTVQNHGKDSFPWFCPVP